jgi:cell division septation protein DedD
MKSALAFVILILTGFSAPRCGATVYHSDGSAVNVQLIHDIQAIDGDTITLPAGTFTWSTPVTISKAIKLQGAGSGRIIGWSRSNQTFGTGIKVFTVQSGFTAANGTTLRIWKTATNKEQSYMLGTVSSVSGTTLTMNITQNTGSGSAPLWLIATEFSTRVVHNAGSNTLLTITETAAGSPEISGIQFTSGTGTSHTMAWIYTSGGQPILLHDCWFNQTNNGNDSTGSGGTIINYGTNRGVIWNCSVDWTYYALSDSLFIHLPLNARTEVWTAPSTMGMADTNGRNNIYIEDCDFHGAQGALDADNNTKIVVRHSVFDHAAFNSHGYETSPFGVRHWEIYDNTFLYADLGPASFNLLQFIFCRGGTGVITDNYFENINSQAYGNRNEITFGIFILGCWILPPGAYSANDNGFVQYPAPRQFGLGYVTGTGHDGQGNSISNGVYVGDSEPAYIWNNTGFTPVIGIITNNCQSFQTDNPLDYIQAGRDYIIGPKPGYQKFTYPHPLRSGNPTPTPIPTATPTATPFSTPTSTPTPTAIPTATATATATPTATPTPTPTPTTTAPILINCGGLTYLDSAGQLWSADMDFVGGSTFSTTHSITGTSDPTLYQTVRYAPTLTYNIPVVNDTYTVTLHFAEIYFDGPGQRVFNVSIEGQTVLQNFDIWAVAGQFAAVQRTFVVTVTDGVLNIVATASFNNAKFSAIQVVPGSSAPTPTPTPSPTATPTPTETSTPTATPTPNQCEVPNFIGTNIHHAQRLWNDAGFTTEVIILPDVNPIDHYITWQSLPEGFTGSCSDTTIIVQ